MARGARHLAGADLVAAEMDCQATNDSVELVHLIGLKEP